MGKKKPQAPAEATEQVEESVEQPQAPAEATPSKKASKGEFTVFDSNGSVFRVVKDEEEARQLANIIGGKFK